MSKMPMESRPIRLSPDIARAVESRLSPLSGKRLESAQEAIVRVYQSGEQMSQEQWVVRYDQAITAAVQSVKAIP